MNRAAIEYRHCLLAHVCCTGTLGTVSMLLALLLPAGCYRSAPYRTTGVLVAAYGTVTLDGEPLEDAVVLFQAGDGSFSYAQTDDEGYYELQFDSQEMGVTPGTKRVRISMNRRIKGLNSTDEGGPEDRAGGSYPNPPPERVPERYNTQSELQVEVLPSRKRYDFDLRS